MIFIFISPHDAITKQRFVFFLLLRLMYFMFFFVCFARQSTTCNVLGGSRWLPEWIPAQGTRAIRDAVVLLPSVRPFQFIFFLTGNDKSGAKANESRFHLLLSSFSVDKSSLPYNKRAEE